MSVARAESVAKVVRAAKAVWVGTDGPKKFPQTHHYGRNDGCFSRKNDGKTFSLLSIVQLFFSSRINFTSFRWLNCFFSITYANHVSPTL